MKNNELLEYADRLLQAALAKTHDMDEAEDLVQETYLHTFAALAKGVAIEKPEAYLFSVLKNRFFLTLRKKYQLDVTSYDMLPVEPGDDGEALESVIRSEEAETVRRELARLSRIYREVMARYYLQGQSVAEIARELNLPKGTILSRLNTGRQKIKKGVETMEQKERYGKNSILPEILTLSINGRDGRDKEPFSCIQGAIEQNILILAYERPLTTGELSDALGIPAVFLEESVEKLVAAELMKREGSRVFTDFAIRSLDDTRRACETSKRFAAESFKDADAVFRDMAAQYREIDGLRAFDDTYLYILAALSCRQVYCSCIAEAVSGKEERFEDYPDRPNYGKWIATGARYPHGYAFDEDWVRYSISGRCGTDDINGEISLVWEWDTPIGHTHNAHFSNMLTPRERAQAIDAVRTRSVNAFQAGLIPDLEKHSFLRTVGGEKQPAVPYLSQSGFNALCRIEREGGEAWRGRLLDRAADVARKAVPKFPKRISHVPQYLYAEPLFFLPMAYIYQAAARGSIPLDRNREYPVMLFVTKD